MLLCIKTNLLKQLVKLFLSVLIIILATSNCARRGIPNGGLKDSIPPVLVSANPPYKSILFSEKKIKIYFDEYVNLKDVNQQLIISPPLKYPPVITPLGSPSKVITIKLSDTLLPNTTYTINFGNSISDNNEGNKLPGFKYVFSTGDYIDSLSVRGRVKDAYTKKTEENISVLLYKITSDFYDSIIYQKKPDYYTSTLDTTLFEITNVSKGAYLLVALKDVYNNVLFNPTEDKIGMISQPIELPKDSLILSPIKLFKETANYQIYRPQEISKGHLIFGYEGSPSNVTIEELYSKNSTFKSIFKQDANKDTIHYWFNNFKKDSLLFKVTNGEHIDTLKIRLRSNILDSLKINSNASNVLHLRDTFQLTSNNPVVKIDPSKISFTNKDSLSIKFKPHIHTTNNTISIVFDKKHTTSYKVQFFPGALTDLHQTTNDTLTYRFSTRKLEDYGSISLEINKQVKSPLIVELLEENRQEVLHKEIVATSTTVTFNLLPPGKYSVRIIIDENNNQKWDTGSYLRKLFPEKVIYHPVIFDVRPDWHFPEKITIN